MANLIITVISIALVAVAALMGAYYGGSAFMDGQAKAKANEIVNAFEQVSGALQMYNSSNNLVYNQMNYTLSFLTPSYLTTIPRPSGAATGTSSWGPPEYQPFMYLNSPLVTATLILFIPSDKTCKALETIRTGTITTNLRTYSGGGDPNADFTGRTGCFYDSVNTWGGGSSAAYIGYYTLYGPTAP